jgi:hypothetical protein
MIEASCHCGEVRVRVPATPDTVTSCNCSICRRLGTLWAYYPEEEVEVLAAAEATSAYVWGEGRLGFHHCRGCGCTVFWRGVDPAWKGREGVRRMGVNARLMPPEAIADVRIRHLDGADTWTYLD